MGHWGIKSYDNDDAADALDAAYERIHGQAYVDMMEDGNPLTVEQIQANLSNAQTLAAAIEDLNDQAETPEAEWDEVHRLAFAGIIVRHAELGVPVPAEWRDKAIAWLEAEAIEWEDATKRRLRRDKEVAMLKSAPA
jgi:hypothetical protein